MARQSVSRGSAPNDHANAESIYSAIGKINNNFEDLYALQSQTVNAGDVRFQSGATTEERIQLAIDQAVEELAGRVFVPASMLPYDPSLVTFDSSVRMTREGGDFSVYDVQAYGADTTGVIDAGPAWNACRAAIPAGGGPMRVPFGTYDLTTAFSFGTHQNVRLLIDAGVTLTGQALPVTAALDNNTIIDFRSGLAIVGGGISVSLTPRQLAIYQAPSGILSGNVGSRPEYGLFASRGTIAVPTAIRNADCLGVVGFYGHNGSDYTSAPAASIYVNALEDFTGTANGTEMAFLVTAPGAAVSATEAYYAMTASAFRPATHFANLVDLGSASIPFRYGRFKSGVVVGDDNAGVYTLLSTNLTTGVILYQALGGSDPYHQFNTRIRHVGIIDTTGADVVLQRASVTMLTLGTSSATFAKGDITLTPASNAAGIHTDTADASDNAVFKISPGGSFSSSRGALIQLFGNEHASTGQLIMTSGNVSGATVVIQNKGTTKITVDTALVTFVDAINLPVGGVQVSATKVVGARVTGYVAFTGTNTNRGTAYDTATITLPQLAERVRALQVDLTAHGLIGT
jgi:hypothetical protein